METMLMETEKQIETTKKCPYCAELIQNEAIKCRFCGEFLFKLDKPKDKWYFSTTVIVIMLLSFPPLALPFVWLNPKYKTTARIIWTVVVIILTLLFIQSLYLIADTYRQLNIQLNQLGL